jgi:hypothetical protein
MLDTGAALVGSGQVNLYIPINIYSIEISNKRKHKGVKV